LDSESNWNKLIQAINYKNKQASYLQILPKIKKSLKMYRFLGKQRKVLVQVYWNTKWNKK